VSTAIAKIERSQLRNILVMPSDWASHAEKKKKNEKNEVEIGR